MYYAAIAGGTDLEGLRLAPKCVDEGLTTRNSHGELQGRMVEPFVG